MKPEMRDLQSPPTGVAHRRTVMNTITSTKARAQLAKTMDQVCESHEPIVITRSGEPSVVMLSLADYKSLEETAYLLSSPRNAKRLIESIAELEGSLKHAGEP